MSKVIATTLGLAATVAAPIVAVQQLSSSEITVFLIAEDGATSGYTGKFGYDFSYYLASTKNENNKSWWEQIAKVRWDKDKETQGYTFSNEFANIAEGYEGTNSLKEKCDSAYKLTTKGRIHPAVSQTENQKKHERDIWKYCSIRGELPITIDKSKDEWDQTLIKGESTAGKDGKQNLISTRDPRNNWFWETQEKTLSKKIGTKEMSSHESHFNNFNSVEGNGVKEKCETLYKSSSKGKNISNIKAQAALFCSLIASR